MDIITPLYCLSHRIYKSNMVEPFDDQFGFEEEGNLPSRDSSQDHYGKLSDMHEPKPDDQSEWVNLLDEDNIASQPTNAELPEVEKSKLCFETSVCEYAMQGEAPQYYVPPPLEGAEIIEPPAPNTQVQPEEQEEDKNEVLQQENLSAAAGYESEGSLSDFIMSDMQPSLAGPRNAVVLENLEHLENLEKVKGKPRKPRKSEAGSCSERSKNVAKQAHGYLKKILNDCENREGKHTPSRILRKFITLPSQERRKLKHIVFGIYDGKRPGESIKCVCREPSLTGFMIELFTRLREEIMMGKHPQIPRLKTLDAGPTEPENNEILYQQWYEKQIKLLRARMTMTHNKACAKDMDQ